MIPGGGAEARLWSKIDAPDAVGCWRWKAATASLWDMGQYRSARRVVWDLRNPDSLVRVGEWVKMDCGNRRCVNPDHMRVLREKRRA